MKILDVTQHKLVADRVRVAKTFFQRLRGLLGTSHLDSGEGLLIPKCQGIHTFGMAYAIDVIYVDHENRVLQITEGIVPNKFGPVDLKAHAVLEFPEHTVENEHISVGDQLCLIDGEEEMAASSEKGKKLSPFPFKGLFVF